MKITELEHNHAESRFCEQEGSSSRVKERQSQSNRSYKGQQEITI